MIKPLVSPDIWAKRYDIEIEERPCGKCGKDFKPDVPVAMKHYRGMISEDRGCGQQFTHCVFVAISEEKIKFWKDIF